MKLTLHLSSGVVLLFSIACGLAVANVYYAQPLLEALAADAVERGRWVPEPVQWLALPNDWGFVRSPQRLHAPESRTGAHLPRDVHGTSG